MRSTPCRSDEPTGSSRLADTDHAGRAALALIIDRVDYSVTIALTVGSFAAAGRFAFPWCLMGDTRTRSPAQPPACASASWARCRPPSWQRGGNGQTNFYFPLVPLPAAVSTWPVPRSSVGGIARRSLSGPSPARRPRRTCRVISAARSIGRSFVSDTFTSSPLARPKEVGLPAIFESPHPRSLKFPTLSR